MNHKVVAGDPVVVLNKINKWFGTQWILKDISLSVQPGEVIGIIGASGAGKSTLLRCINHLACHDSGQILIDGEPIGIEEKNGKTYYQREGDTARLRAKMGMVFQSFNLFHHMTVMDNITYGPRRVLKQPTAEVETRARALLRSIRLEDKGDSYPSQLSGGQQQRIAIARALAMQPRVVLFDEPTSALDPELVGEVLDVIRSLANTGVTMLIVTHEMDFIRELADTVVYMDHGRVIEVGTPEQIFDNPSMDRTQKFLRYEANIADEPVRRTSADEINILNSEGHNNVW